MRAGFILAAVALLALTQPAACARPDPAPVFPELSVTFDSAQQQARVTESSPGVVQFSGLVSVDKVPQQRIVVTLSATTDRGWALELEPATMIFISTTPQPFTVTVAVPEGTLCTVTGNLEVRASTSGTGYEDEASARAIITVDQYFRVVLTSESPHYTSERSKAKATYALRLWNKGNGPDRFELEVANLKDLVDTRWTVRLDKEATPVIQPGLYGEVTVSLAPPEDLSDFDSRTVTVIIKATSVRGREQNQIISQSLSLYYHFKAVDIVFDVTVPIIVAAVAAASVSLAAWRWKRKRAKKTRAAPDDPEGPAGVGPD